MVSSRTVRIAKAIRPGTGARSAAYAAKIASPSGLTPLSLGNCKPMADAENRILTNYVETALLRDLSLRDEAARVIAMHAAHGTSTQIAAADIVRADGESDAGYAKRQDLLTELWSIPDSE